MQKSFPLSCNINKNNFCLHDNIMGQRFNILQFTCTPTISTFTKHSWQKPFLISKSASCSSFRVSSVTSARNSFNPHATYNRSKVCFKMLPSGKKYFQNKTLGLYIFSNKAILMTTRESYLKFFIICNCFLKKILIIDKFQMIVERL